MDEVHVLVCKHSARDDVKCYSATMTHAAPLVFFFFEHIYYNQTGALVQPPSTL